MNQQQGGPCMHTTQVDDIVFQHLIDLPNCDCVFCSTLETSSGRTRLFLIFNECRRIYVRNAIKETWDEIKDQTEYEIIRSGFERVVESRNIPCFSL